MKMASGYQDSIIFLGSLSLIRWITTTTALSYFESSTPYSDFEIIPFSNQSSFPSVGHPLVKRDAYETLRDLTSGGSDDPESSVIQRRLWNSSVALTIPMFSFRLPHVNGGGFIVNQAVYGLFAFIITAIPYGLAFIFTGAVPTVPTEGQRSLSKSAKSSNFNFLGSKFSESIGMDGVLCLQKVVCQAHRSTENKKYGIIARSIQMLFKAPVNLTIESELSPLKKAAWDGRHSKESCEKLFDCLIDALGSARYLAHWYGMDKLLLG